MLKLPRSQQGFTLLDGIIALSVLMSLLVLGSQYAHRQLEELLQQSAALHLRRVTTAAIRYGQDHYDVLGSLQEKRQWESEQQQRPAEQTLLSLEAWRYQRLIEQGYLPTPEPMNCYGQAYALYIQGVNPSAGSQWQLLVLTTGGRAMREGALLSVARQVGGQGGYITQKMPDTLIGTQRGWQRPVPPKTVYQAVNHQLADSREQEQRETPGHVATLQIIDPDDILNSDNLLHRTKQPPDKQHRHRMESDLVMQQHQIIFKAPEIEARLSAQGLQFQRDRQRLELGWNPLSKKARIVLQDPQGGVVMSATRVATTGKPSVNTDLKKYSAPELRADWNKVPYYELSAADDTQQAGDIRQAFADQVCAEPPSENETALGRLFMLGHEQMATTALYLCSHGASPAQVIGQFPPESSAASTQTSPSPAASVPATSKPPLVKHASPSKKLAGRP